jgi:hypothetical protein
LAAPVSCIPGYPAASRTLIDAAMSRLEPTMGYAFQSYSGPPPSRSDMERARASKRSLTALAVVAAPLPGNRLRPAFCGDSSGRLCVRGDGTMPGVKEGKCPETCQALR